MVGSSVQVKKISPKYTVILLLVVVVAAVILLKTKPQPQAKLLEPTPMRVVVTEVVTTDFQPSVVVSGYLRPARQAALRFEVAGPVVARLVEPGQRVATGEPLLRLDSGDFDDAVVEAQARLAQEQAAVERDRQLLALAQRNRQLQGQEVARQERLGSESLSSRAALDGARQKLLQLETEEERLRFSVETAEARLDLQRVALNRARRNLQRSELRASFDGVVNTVEVDVGDRVNVNQKGVELIDARALDLYIEVDGATAAALQVGQPVQVVAGGHFVDGRLVAIQLNPMARTFTHEVRIRLPNPGLLPGSLAQATLPLAVQRDVAVVPVTAVVRDDGQTFAFTVEGSRLHRHELILGGRQNGQQVVLSGLKVGDRVVARDAAALNEDVVVEY